MSVGLICLIVGVWGLGAWMFIGLLHVGNAKKMPSNASRVREVDERYE